MTKRKCELAKDTCPICIDTLADDSSITWLQCSICTQWYHLKCLKLSAAEISNFQSYHCSDCIGDHGPLVIRRMLKRSRVLIDYVALNEGNSFAVDKAVHPHINNFQNFKPDSVGYNTSDTVTKEDRLASLGCPVYIPSCDLEKVGMALPVVNSIDISVGFVTEQVGEDTPVEVMDVLTQQGVKPGWSMTQWRDYFENSGSRDRIRNVISLEISEAPFGKKFHRPEMVRQMDIADKVWPTAADSLDIGSRPKVTKYCLMSVTGSFTDFHIDFGGTSVYYTVCSGSKQFLMFPPTDHNLKLYQNWCLEQDQNFIWYPTYSSDTRSGGPTGGIKVTLTKGDLFIIPSGWIHSVYTPEDSVVIGGNYLTLADLPMQLKINEIEKCTKVPARFRFPEFNKLWWLASWYYMNNPERLNLDVPGIKIEVKEEEGCIKHEHRSTARNIMCTLTLHLQLHYTLSKTYKPARSNIPTVVIGKDIEAYLVKLKRWCDGL